MIYNITNKLNFKSLEFMYPTQKKNFKFHFSSLDMKPSYFTLLAIIAIVFVSGCVSQVHGPNVPNAITNVSKNITQIVGQSPNINHPLKINQTNRNDFEKRKINPYLGVPCTSNPNLKFSHDLSDYNLIEKITPPSLFASKAQDRAWLWIDQSKTNKVPIYAPVDADLVRGVYKTKTNEGKETIDYDLHFQVSCEVWFFINHISDPIDKIKEFFPNTPASSIAPTGSPTVSDNFVQISPPLHFSAGDMIGYTKGTALAHSFDFAVFDLNNTNKLIGVVRSSDTRFNNFICPFDVFPENIKSSYYQKLIPDLVPESNCK